MKTKIEFELGATVWKQRVVLVKEADDTYTLIKQAVNQRDETDVIRGLTKEIIQNMLRAIDKRLV